MSEEDMLAAEATEIRFSESAPGDPVRVDPCDYTDDPGFVLTPDEVLVPDLCLSLIPNVESCWVSDYDEPNDLDPLPGAPELDIWCEFDCDGEGLEVARVLASFPGPDEGPEHYAIPNPCL